MQSFLPDETRVSQVRLRTRNLGEALAFYEGALGLKPIEKTSQGASLSATGKRAAILVLEQESNARPRPAKSTGLFHLAMRYPSRENLSRGLRRLLEHGQALEGASDHIVSEALYLSDPEGNGIELYSDRPRTQWEWQDGQVKMATKALDLKELLQVGGNGQESAGLPSQTDIGHIHLQVAELAAAEHFYKDFLGLAVTQRSYPGALFFSAGGYHHHIAVNTWGGQNPAPENSTGLISYRLAVPTREVLYCLQHRAPLAGYEATTRSEGGGEILAIRDANGNTLEIECAT
jgi:catechol 2,3-dioxygenase